MVLTGLALVPAAVGPNILVVADPRYTRHADGAKKEKRERAEDGEKSLCVSVMDQGRRQG